MRAPMTDARLDEAFRQVVRRIDPRATLRRIWRLTGGVSAQVTGLEIVRTDGQTTKLLVRRHGEIDRARNAHIARDEFALLQIAQSHGLAAPKPYLFDESGEVFPTPFLVVEYVDGDSDFAPADLATYLDRAAAQLAKIHGVVDSPDLACLPRLDKGFGERPAKLDAAMGEARIRDALDAAWPLAQANESVLLHGDYWPGNLLWKDGELVAVIDWEDAHVGDPLAVLANSRLEFLWSFGLDAMLELTARYRSMNSVDVANLPFWDLCAALRPCGKLAGWGLDDVTGQRMSERHEMFVTQALAHLPAR